MTTLIGIVSRKEEPVVILGSDLSATRTSWKDHGDIAIKEQTKTDVSKIYVSDNNNLAFASAGLIDDIYGQLVYDLRTGKVDIGKITKEERFPQLLGMHLKRFGNRIWYPDATTSMLFATRSNIDGKMTPELYTAFPLGAVEKRDFTAIGSGSDFAIEYMRQYNLIDTRDLSVADAIRYVNGALNAATRDIYTGGNGIGLVVVDSMGIKNYSTGIQNAVRDARQTAIEDIIKRRETKSK